MVAWLFRSRSYLSGQEIFDTICEVGRFNAALKVIYIRNNLPGMSIDEYVTILLL